MKKIVLALHGGAGDAAHDLSGHAEHLPQVDFMRQTLVQGFERLKQGRSALDVVEEVIIALEDFPGFNAGRGAVLTGQGTVELDAAIMDGYTQDAGAVACVKTIKNPVTAARKLMELRHHVLLVGEAADQFAKEQQLVVKSQDYFITEARRAELKRLKERHTASSQSLDNPLGTVGAVALDSQGRLACATSTGGTANQMPGRVGDSPIIGAGTWADAHCAVSATGKGEMFMRCVYAYRISALMQYRGLSLQAACEQALHDMQSLGGAGGSIALDKNGQCAILHSTRYLYHGMVDETGKVTASTQALVITV